MAERNSSSSWEQVTGLVALAVGVLAMVISAYTAYVQRNQARLSAWPHLMVFWSEPGNHVVVANKGVGPALVKRVDLTLDGAPVRNWEELLTRALGPGKHDYGWSSIDDAVLTAAETNPVLTVGDDAQYKALIQMRGRIDMQICYCSVYDDCWRGGYRGGTTAVSSCPKPDANSFTQ